ncbi:MAG: tetratricopeptide repeat protein [Bacteroidales bacterium]
MKKLGIITLMLIFSVSTFAQKGKVTSAKSKLDQGNVKEAYETLKSALEGKDEKMMAWPNTWMIAGQIYSALGKDAKTKNLVSEPLKKASESYLKAADLDEKGRYTNQLKQALILFKQDLGNAAGAKYNEEKNYVEAFRLFQEIEKIDNSSVMKDDAIIDTVTIYNTGLTGYTAELYEECIPYFEKAASYGYQADNCYQIIGDSYIKAGKEDEAIKFFESVFEKNPSNVGVLGALTNIYINQGKSKEAVKYLKLAIDQDPSNKTYYFALGALQEKLENVDEALSAYTKAIEIDDQYFDAYYNIGALYYNKGVQLDQKTNELDLSDNAGYDRLKKESAEEFKKAIPYFEKAAKIKPEDSSCIENLKNIYYRVGDTAKYEEMKNLLDK